MSGRANRPRALGEFLRARREQVGPGQVGIPDYGRRRVPGLRREELALLAGVSIDYYVRLEQGRDHHPSVEVLDALARALQLDAATTAYLHQLGRPAPPRRRRPRRPETVRPSVLQLLAAWPTTPAFVLGQHADILAANPLAVTLWRGFEPGGNLLRAVFTDPAAVTALPGWDQIASDAVANLRGTVGADTDNPDLITLVGELAVKSEDFRRRWARHDVRTRADGAKRFQHPVVGQIEVNYESLTLSDPGQTLVVCHARPGSPDATALALLAGYTTMPGATTTRELQK